MESTIVLGLTILCTANLGNTFEFSGLNPSTYNKAHLKSDVKLSPTLNNQPQLGFKPTFGLKNVAAKPYTLPLETFKQPFQPIHHDSFRGNYQPFGPYTGYPGPVVYSSQNGYPGPAAFLPPSYRFDGFNQKQFGFQPFLAPVQPPFGSFKFGPKKVNKNFPGSVEFNAPGKYFQEHQFGVHHEPEFSSAVIPAEHNIKQTKPKDTLLGKPAVPSETFLKDLGLPKQEVFGFGPTPSFGYPVPHFSPIQPFFQNTPAAEFNQKLGGIAVTTATQGETATSRSASEVTVEPSATPAVESSRVDNDESRTQQTEVPSQEVAVPDITTAVEAATSSEAPAADDSAIATVQQSEQSGTAEAGEPTAAAAAVQENDSLVKETLKPVVVEEVKETVIVDDSPATEKFQPVSETPLATPENVAVEKSEEVKETAVPETVPEAKPVESVEKPQPEADKLAQVRGVAVSNLNVLGLPNEVFASIGAVSDSSTASLFTSSELPYFGQSVNLKQGSYYPSFDTLKFTEEELKAFTTGFGASLPQSNQITGNNVPLPVQVVGSTDTAIKINDVSVSSLSTESTSVSTKNSESASSTPSVDNVEKSENVVKAEKGEKTETTVLEFRSEPEAPKKSNTVQIIGNDFSRQFPLSTLYEPSNPVPLDSIRFYNHPSVSSLSSQASLASYSPENTFASFGGQLRQGYLVESLPAEVPLSKTVVETTIMPLSISSKEHPLHSEVFKYSPSFVPYPGLVADATPVTFRSLELSSTAVPSIVSSSTVTSAEAVFSSVTESAINKA